MFREVWGTFVRKFIEKHVVAEVPDGLPRLRRRAVPRRRLRNLSHPLRSSRRLECREGASSRPADHGVEHATGGSVRR